MPIAGSVFRKGYARPTRPIDPDASKKVGARQRKAKTDKQSKVEKALGKEGSAALAGLKALLAKAGLKVVVRRDRRAERVKKAH